MWGIQFGILDEARRLNAAGIRNQEPGKRRALFSRLQAPDFWFQKTTASN
jgi:hypothetical protein